MKVLWQQKGIIFDNVTLELKSGKIIDTEHYEDYYEECIYFNEVKSAWGYICKDCAEKHNIDINDLGGYIDGMVCYVKECKEIQKTYEIMFNEQDIKSFKIVD